MNWEEAYSFCRKKGSVLPSIISEAENDYITSLMPNQRVSVWLGGTLLVTDRWGWVDGSEWSGYENWREGEPNGGNYKSYKLMMYGYPLDRRGKWNDEKSDWKKNGVVCSHKP